VGQFVEQNMKHERFTGLEQRGRVYYLRVRVPSKFADVEPRVEINRSLKTRDRAEAEARCAIAKAALLHDWRARKSWQEAPHARESFDASIELLNAWGLKYRPMQKLIEGPIEDLLQRVETVMRAGHDAAALPVALGAVELPHILLSEMPPEMEKLRAKDAAAKNARQLREWRAKYERAASYFKELVSDKNVLEITEADAPVYFEHWKKLHAESAITANYAAKKLRFMR
jgi:hypothetical protein